MNRRGFLSGLLASVAGSKIVLNAEPKAVELFAPMKDEPLIITSPQIVAPTNPYVSIGSHLYNEHGEIVCEVQNYNVYVPADGLASITIEGYLVGIPRRVSDIIDVTTLGDTTRHWSTRRRR